MVKIIEALGQQDPDIDFSFVDDKFVKKYITKIYQDQGYKSFHSFQEKLQMKYNKTDPKIISLIAMMLEFNPYFRTTAKEALRHSVFNSIRIDALEKSA